MFSHLAAITELYASSSSLPPTAQPSSQIWPILPGVSHWIQHTQCVLILQIAMCEIHPTRSWGSSHITQNETASRILPLFFHFAVPSGRLGPGSSEALWWKPIRQILEECSGGAAIPGCQSAPHFHINISVMLAWRSDWIILFSYIEINAGNGACILFHVWEKISSVFFFKNASLDLLITSVRVSQPMWG